MTARAGERGFAMVLAILAIALLGAGLMAAFLLSGSERRSVTSQASQVEAFALAENGLERFLSNRAAYGFNSSPAGAYESTRISLTNGYADVVLQRVRPQVGTSDGVYVVRSTGTSTAGALSGLPAATRTVAQYATWRASPMTVLSAWTSLTGMRKTGGSGTISGADACAAQPSVAGVAVATPPGYTQTGGASVPAGTPNIQNLGSSTAAAAAVRIDWLGITNGTSLTPDITIPSGSWPSFANASYWPIIKVTGNYALPGSGRGTLIVTGNLTISGSKTWDGVILVGGTLTSSGNNTVRGSVVTGLNVKLGQSPGQSDVGSGTKTYRYSSCNVASALARFTGLTALPNAWLDNWARY